MVSISRDGETACELHCLANTIVHCNQITLGRFFSSSADKNRPAAVSLITLRYASCWSETIGADDFYEYGRDEMSRNVRGNN